MKLPRSAFAVAIASLVTLTVAIVSGLAVARSSRAIAPSPSCSPDGGKEVRLGWFATATHAPAIVGIERGLFAKALRDVKLTTATFNAGPAAIEALFSGAIDATYVGPNPAINAFVKSKGEAVRVVAGATSGGAFLVVDPSIQSAADLKGRKVASPQLGNTQDVALRAWLKSQGLKVALRGASEVTIVPQENALTLDAFRQKQIAGAWLPEPWASRMVLEGGAKVLVDERDLWPDRRFVTVELLVRTDFLRDRPEAVKALLRGHLDAQEWLRDPAHESDAKRLVNDAIGKVTGRKLDAKLLDACWKNLEFTDDPIASSLRRSAQDAQDAGLLDLGGLDLSRIHDLRLLNDLLKERGAAAIDS
jgi:NitT/TauT family transport system substrate-binding protein